MGVNFRQVTALEAGVLEESGFQQGLGHVKYNIHNDFNLPFSSICRMGGY